MAAPCQTTTAKRIPSIDAEILSKNMDVVMTPETVFINDAELLETLASLWSDEDVAEERVQNKPLDWTMPADINWNRVEERARRYLMKLPRSVQGQSANGRTSSAQTLIAARVLVNSYAMPIDRAFILLSEYSQQQCDPPWSQAELMHKLEDADKSGSSPGHPRGEFLRPFIRETRRKAAGLPATSRQRPTSFWNYSWLPDERSSTCAEKPAGLPLQTIVNNLNAITGGWPKRVGKLLFAIQKHRPLWIQSASELFAWIAAQLPVTGPQNGISWDNGKDMIKHGQLFDYLTQNAEQFDAVELYPHEPRFLTHCYVHQDLTGGDGKAFNELLSRFIPSTDVDGMLIRAFFLSLIWGGLQGSRPVWLFTGEEEEEGGGRGIGKSAIAQLGGLLVGGYVSLSQNEDIGDIQRRLLSPISLEQRVVLLDNIKSLRFSWGELESLTTDFVISGRQMYTGEGKRPNTLVWVLTFNGASLSKDLSFRCLVVKLKKPTYTATWMRDAVNFIEANRFAILGDIVAELQRPVEELKYCRWGPWEREVLSHVADPKACQAILAERASEVDDDREEMETVREAFRDFLKRRKFYDPDAVWVKIPSADAANVLNAVNNEHRSTNSAMRLLYLLKIPEITKNKSKKQARGCIWRGSKTQYTAPLLLDGTSSSDEAAKVQVEENDLLDGFLDNDQL